MEIANFRFTTDVIIVQCTKEEICYLQPFQAIDCR